MSGIDQFTKLMVHGEKTTSNTTKPISFFGNAQLSTTQRKIGASTLSLDGSGDYLSIPDSTDWAFGTNDLTIEFWVRFNSLSNQCFFNQDVGVDTDFCQMSYDNSGHRLYMDLRTGATYIMEISIGWTPVINTWYHVAITRTATTNWKMFINGVSQTVQLDIGSYSASWPDLAGTFQIGRSNYGAGLYVNGYMDEFRVTKGLARYSSNFTPATTEFISDSFTVLLLHFDGANGATSTADSSGGDESSEFPGNIDKIMTYHGSAQTTTGFSKFSGASLTFNGTTDYIDTPASTDFTPLSGDYTYDFWLRTTQSTAGAIFGQANSAADTLSHYCYINAVAGKIRWYANKDGVSGVSVDSTTTINDNLWHHIACVIYNGKLFLFVDGILQAVPVSIGGSLPNIPYKFAIGRIGEYNGLYYAGQIDEFRASKGIARWTSDFTPPTAQYTYSDTPSVQSIDAFTKLLLKGNKTNNTVSKAITFNSTAQLSTAQSKFGYSSCKFNGSTDNLSLTNNDDFLYGTNDFTFDFWFQPSSLSGVQGLFGSSINANFYYSMYIDATNIYFENKNGSGNINIAFNGTHGLVINKWHHIAVVRNGSNFKIYVNGVSVASTTSANSLYTGSGTNFFIGQSNYTTIFVYTNGYIDEFRASTIARYTATFVPATSKYLSDSSTHLLIHFDGVNAATSTADSSGGDESSLFDSNIDKIISYFGNAKTSTAQSKFGNSSLLFDGSGSYVNISDSSDFTLGANDFTIDFWVRRASIGTLQFIAGQINSAGQANSASFHVKFNTDNTVAFTVFDASLHVATSTGTITDTTTFHHIAGVRYGNTLTLYIDGIADGTADLTGVTINDSSNNIAVGRAGEFTTFTFDGNVDEFRFSKGIARWTTTFIPSTSAYSYIASTEGTDIFTKLLLTGNKLNNSKTSLVTFNGGAKISTERSKFGNSSIKFSTGGDYLAIPNSSDLEFGSGDFTIDTWIFTTAYPPIVGNIFQRNSDNNGSAPFNFRMDTNGSLFIGLNDSNIGASTTVQTITLHKWQHVAVVRSGNTGYIFIDGVVASTWSFTGTVNASSAIASIGDVAAGGPRNFVGYMDEYRVSKGIARWTSTFTPATSQLTSDKYTALLFHFNGANNATTTADSSGGDESSIYPSNSDKIITFNGGAKVDNTTSIFEGSSLVFANPGDYLSTPDSSDFDCSGGSPFCIDFWIKINNYGSSYKMVFAQYSDSSNGMYFYFNNDGTGQFTVLNAGSAVVAINRQWNLTVGQWYHMAFIRGWGGNKDAWVGCVNGVPIGATVISSTNPLNYTGPFEIGQSFVDGSSHGLVGNIDEFRFTNGLPRWTNNFIPPTAPYAYISNTTDGIDSYTKLLVRADKFSTDIAHPITFLGTGQLDTAQSKFGVSSLKVTSGGNVARIADHANFTLGTSDFTIETWFRSASGFGTIISQAAYELSDAAWYCYIDPAGANGQFAYSTNGTGGGFVTFTFTCSPAITTNTWHHMAFVRQGSLISLFIDGVQQSTSQSIGAALSIRDSAQPIVLGGDQATGVGDSWTGWIDEPRISKIARYTSNFTPATSQFTSDRDTLFLCHFDGTNGSTSVADSSGGDESSIFTGNIDKILTYSGNAQHSSNLSVFGNSSLLFDGSGDYIQAASATDFNLGTGDFTIDFWAKLSSLAGYNVMFDMRPGSSGFYPTIYTDITTGILYFYTNAANRITGPALTINQWYHIAVTKHNGQTKLFVNGILQGNIYFESNTYLQAPITIGAESLTIGTNCVNGYIDEVRVTKGLARWTSDFTPPNSEYLKYVAPPAGANRFRRPIIIM